MIKKRLKIYQKTVIPVIRKVGDWSSSFYLGSKYKNKIGIVEDDELDQFKYFAVKGAALLSGNPENIGLQIQKILEHLVRVSLQLKMS